MRKRNIFPCFLALCLMLSGCSRMQQHTLTYLDLFDTVTTVTAVTCDEETFQQQAQTIRARLEYYHRLFDIYNSYDGVNNLKTVNDNAGIRPVQVDGELIQFLQACVRWYELSGGRVNVAMGSVLQLWHSAREYSLTNPDSAYIPTVEELEQAAEHMDIGCIQIDEAAGTVYITDPQVQLDVGAVGKGWAAQCACEGLPSGILISVGGNVCVTGPKEDGQPWAIGVQHPRREEELLCSVRMETGSLVTSGDYQRTFTVDGNAYHHIIDPDTLMPGTNWCSVTIYHPDSGVADALSTALFLMPLDEGRELAQRMGAQVLWVDAELQEYTTQGFDEMLR